MTRNKSALPLGLVAVALLSMTAAAAAPALKFTFKDVTVPKALETDSYGINNAGTIAGDYVDANGVQHGMILAGKKVTKVDIKNCTTTPTGGIAFYGINKSNVAAGWCTDTTSGQSVAFTYSKGKVTTIAYPKALGTQLNGLNDAGTLVGNYIDANGAQNAFVYAKKKYSKLKPPSGVASTANAWAINNKGVITVYGFDSTGAAYISGYTADNGKTYKKFAYPKAGTTGTVVHAINNNGDVDGTYFDANSGGHGVLLHGGKYYAFDDPKASNSTRADGLNDTLGIVGRYTPSAGGNYGFFAQAK